MSVRNFLRNNWVCRGSISWCWHKACAWRKVIDSIIQDINRYAEESKNSIRIFKVTYKLVANHSHSLLFRPFHLWLKTIEQINSPLTGRKSFYSIPDFQAWQLCFPSRYWTWLPCFHQCQQSFSQNNRQAGQKVTITWETEIIKAQYRNNH